MEASTRYCGQRLRVVRGDHLLIVRVRFLIVFPEALIDVFATVNVLIFEFHLLLLVFDALVTIQVRHVSADVVIVLLLLLLVTRDQVLASKWLGKRDGLHLLALGLAHLPELPGVFGLLFAGR